ncbi:hypothetical protein L2Y94_20915 [Luteibacter aegosomatis]|uniref:DUF6624 domain-containing protein n=1 Tax=Luteibacter aegosomatis TaxID=2911537 RepID=UPI001FFABB77|nr:DUF6624 domain-containing protein [Luteibacter aegosomatis]UPG85722.1 hypothetical protein L2Y94_20915 [Luteibacter aegosomatis]
MDATGGGDLDASQRKVLFDTLASSHLLERPTLDPGLIEAIGRLLFRAKGDPDRQSIYLDDFPGLWPRAGIDVDPLGLANLEDRVAHSQGRPQIYGTLPARKGDYEGTEATRIYAASRDMLGVAADAPTAPDDTPLPLAMRHPVRPSLPDVRAELLRLGRMDQSVRQDTSNMASEQVKAMNAEAARIDEYTLPRIRTIFDRYGLPSSAQVGRAAIHSAFLLIQHAVSDPGLMRAAVAPADAMRRLHELPAVDYALLVDRVDCVIDRRPQRFGTQGSRDPKSYWYCTIDDPQHVNDRRAALHLFALKDDEIYGTPAERATGK